MAGVFTALVLADGQMASSKTTMYSNPNTTKTYIKFFSIYNSSSTTTETVLIYAKDVSGGNASRVIARCVLSPLEQARIVDKDEVITLDGNADLIEGTTTNATTVDFFITGVQET